MSNETNQLWAELSHEEAADIQGGWYFNVPFFSPVVGYDNGKVDGPAPGSYDSRTTGQNYGFFSAWKGGTDSAGVDYSGFSSYIPGTSGWWEPGGTSPTDHNAGAFQVFWDP